MMGALAVAPSRALAGWALALGLGALGAAPARAADLATALPHVLWVGTPPGPASARDVDASGTRRASALPEPQAARVAWQRRLAGGASGSVLADAGGRLFVPGQRRITELASDGSPAFEREAPFTSSVAAALLADGTRALLTREGRVMGWSRTGAQVLMIELATAPPNASSALLPLPGGGFLVATGRWLFAVDAGGGEPLHASLPSAVAHARLVGERALVVDEDGRVFDWPGHGAARELGRLSAPATTTLGDEAQLIALTTARTLEAFDPIAGRTRELTRFEPPGPLPLLAVLTPGRWVTLTSDGDWLALGDGAAAPGRLPSPRDGSRAGDAQLLVDTEGRVARWAANRSLTLDGAGLSRQLPDVRCADPVALVPAGAGQLVAVCGTGALWFVDAAPGSQPGAQIQGPEALASAADRPYIRDRSGSGTSGSGSTKATSP